MKRKVVRLFSPVAHLCSPFFLLLTQSPAYFPEMYLNLFLLETDFLELLLFLVVVFSGWEMISWSVVSVIACYCMALVLAGIMQLDTYLFFNFLMMFVDVFFTCFCCKLVLINQTERSTIPACPSFIAIVHKGNTESTIFRFV